MSELQRFVPNGCEFYQYREVLEDVFGPTGEREPVLLKTLSVRRKSDGLYFAMTWHDEASAQRAAAELAEDVQLAPVGGCRVDLGQANVGQSIRVAGSARGLAETIIAVNLADKTYTIRNGNRVIPWSQAREP